MGLFNPSRHRRRSTSTALSFSELQAQAQALREQELAEATLDEVRGPIPAADEPVNQAHLLSEAERERAQAEYAENADQPRWLHSGDAYTATSWRLG